jgi:hydroxymethylpyrimidine/phosphomethylpyrimidine kinase
MATDPTPSPNPGDPNAEPAPPACVMSFNANDPSGACGLAGDVATIAAMGAHPLPVATAIVMRDTAEVFDHHALEPEVVVEQARSILEDVTVAAWKAGFLGNAESVAAVAEILSDYPDVPLVTYLTNLSWLDDDALAEYHDALRDLILPQTAVLVGNHKTLADFLLPDWESERAPSARELAKAAAEHGARFVLVTGVALPGKANESFVDNVLASPQGAITGEKFERFEAAFVGAGETLSAALAALLAAGSELHDAVGEALQFLDQALDAGFRPGMGNVVPDRFFWALGQPEDGAPGENGEPGDGSPAQGDTDTPSGPRRIH